MSELQRLRDRIEQLESLLGLDRNIAGRLRDAFMITRAQAETLCFMLRRNFVSHEALYITLYGARPDCDQPDPRIMDVQVHHLRTALRKHGIALKTRWGEGWTISPADKAKVRAVLEAADALVAEIPKFLPHIQGIGR